MTHNDISVSDRPLMDTDRPLFLHDDWDANENYRFEVRQKPKAIMMVGLCLAVMIRIDCLNIIRVRVLVLD